MVSVRRAILFSLVERYLLLVVSLASNIVIARLLVPEQIGVYSVSMAVLGIAQALRDFGVGNFLIQERELDRDKIRAAFGISLMLGCALFVVTMVAAPFIADYYREPRMAATLRITALNFVLLPFCTVSLSLLRRAMQFKRLLYVTMLSSLVGAALSVSLALAGVGENSLAIGAVAVNAAAGLGAWIARVDRELLLPGLRQWRSVLRFGGQSSLAGFVTSVSMDANDLIVGKVLGIHPVAMLSRAQGLMSLFHRDLMGAVRNVALPAFANAHRRGEQIAAPFLRSVAMVTVFAWPFYGMVSIYALEILSLLYGPQWLEAAPLVPIFCAAGAAAAINALIPNLLVAIGRMDLVMRLELLMQPLRVIFIAVAAVWFQTIMACAVAYLLSAVLTVPVAWWFKRLCVPDDRQSTWHCLRSTVLVTLATLAPALVHVSLVGWVRHVPIPLWQWVSVAALGIMAGVVAVQLFSHPLSSEAVYVRLWTWCRRRLGSA